MIEDRGSQHYLFDDRVDNPIIAFNRNKGAPGNFEPPRRLRRRGAKQGWLFEPATGPFPPHGRRRFEVLHNGILALVLGRFWARVLGPHANSKVPAVGRERSPQSIKKRYGKSANGSSHSAI